MMPRRMYLVSGLLVIAATVLAACLRVQYPVAAWMPVLALILLNVVTENVAFRLPVAGSVSLSFAVTYAAMLYGGPFAGVLCAAAGAYTLPEFKDRKPAVLALFNVGQLSLSAGLSGLVYVQLGGSVLVNPSWTSAGVWPAAAFAAAITFFVVNVALVGHAASILSGRAFLVMLREQGFLSYGASLLVLALLGLLIANLLALGSWAGLLVLVLPFMFARRTFRVYVELSEAFTATVRSLVAAIEAKDPYTRGHSERVAIYARRLAERLHMSRAQVDLTEQAALLHDVGKIGISLRTLTSSEQLRVNEVHQIRRHPVLGAELVEDVEFLANVVPVIRHHHERPDGTGYPDGLVAAQIPVLARVLAVADCYDAMTSDRAYRVRMTRDEALDEMTRVAGDQLDEGLVSEFRSMILADDTGGDAFR